VAIRDSHNVSSITDNATGDYTVNFANAMTTNTYSLSTQVGNGNHSSNSRAFSWISGSVNGVRVLAEYGTGANSDESRCYVTVHGGV